MRIHSANTLKLHDTHQSVERDTIARQTSKVGGGGYGGGTPGSPRRAVSVVLLETLYI
jgi:hypothetical protein